MDPPLRGIVTSRQKPASRLWNLVEFLISTETYRTGIFNLGQLQLETRRDFRIKYAQSGVQVWVSNHLNVGKGHKGA